MALSLGFLTAFCALSALDAFYFHVWKERLARRPAFQQEAVLHSFGNGITGLLALALAWFEWRGFAILLPLGLVAAESGLGVLDYLEEKRCRAVALPEKAMHLCMLFLHTGFAVSAIAPALEWWSQDSQVVPASHVLQYPLTLAAIALLAGAACESKWLNALRAGGPPGRTESP
jgi:hypothetical protein